MAFSVATTTAVADEVENVPQEELIITASRTNTPVTAIPNTVKVIDRDALEKQLAVSTSLLDGLSFSVPALTPAHQKLSSNGVTLRGRTPLYMTDSIPQSTPLRNGQRSAFTIDPAFIDRVEVIHGANAIQGVGATGGVINYVTIDAPENGEWLKKVSVELTTDDFERDGYHYKAAGVIGKSFTNTDFVLGTTYQLEDLYYDAEGRAIAPDPIQGDLMDSEAVSVFTKLGWYISDTQRVELLGNYFDLNGDGDYRVVPGDVARGKPATAEAGEIDGDPTYNDASNLSLTYTHDDVYQGQLTLQTFYYDFYALYGGGTFGSFQDEQIAPAGELFDQSALSSEKYGAKITYVRDNTFWEGLQITTGLDYLNDTTQQELVQTGRTWVPEMTYSGWAPFLQLSQRLMSNRVHISAGIRYENVELDVPDFTTIAGANNTFVKGSTPSFEELLGNVGVVFNITDQLTAFASYSEGFEMPDAGLILRAVNTPDLTVDDLVDLQPIIADNTEIGLNYHYQGLDLSLNYFWSDSDFGSRIQVVDGVGHITRQKTEIEGLEISANYHFDNGISTGAAYSKLEGRYDSDSDGSIDKDLDGRNIAPDRVNLFVEGPVLANLSARLQYSILLDREFDGGQPQHDFDGYQLADAVLSYQTDTFGDFTLGIENLLDEQYITYFSQTLTYVNNTTYFAGRGRTVTVKWDYAL
ncbi:TonB dependent receptor [Oleiphilus messinensis]|uniref:TonB dependent receptor n=1 Tax=Oleiphilus messinensis TaxID=141451 RepID=A0A1Y0IEN0_9GAMM|nr:TonB-dependent receptor [Oleiphilus messinensis]ARU58256.1 TonB dependent receptor [Oleiphilus messinensis]